MGLNLDYYWNLTPKQYEKHKKAFILKQENKMMFFDSLNYILGQYVGIAFNDPKKYPKKPIVDFDNKNEEVKHQSLSTMERNAKANTVILGGEIK